VRTLVVPTRTEREALLHALPSPLPLSGWGVPAWAMPGCARGELLVLECGMGPARAEALLPELDRASPDAVWLVGWCGGLRDDLRVGDLILADATLTGTAPRAMPGTVRIDHPPPQALADWLAEWAAAHGRRFVVAPVLTSPRVLARAAHKRAAAATGAAAVEMEAAPLARWAAEHSVPFRHLRVVLDPVGPDLPPEELHGEEEQDEGIGRYIWRAVWRLLAHVRRARRTMVSLGAALTAPGSPLRAEH
jgi:adenosylhomocysteine nucleosidase